MAAQLSLNFSNGPRRQMRLGSYGTLSKADLKDLDAANRRVYALLSDGRWHTDAEVIAASRQREGLRRLRELRQIGIDIDTRRLPGRRAYEYRMSVVT